MYPRPSRLLTLMKGHVQQRDWPRLSAWLSGLSHRDFREASLCFMQLTEADLSPDDLLSLFAYLVPTKPKAYLVTLLKVVVAWHKRGLLSLEAAPLLAYAADIGQRQQLIDIKKVSEGVFPHLATPEQVQRYLQAFALNDKRIEVHLLLPCATLACRYTLFQTLRHFEHNKAYLAEILRTLRRQGAGSDYNFSAFLTAYFALQADAVYSLRLGAYELGRIEASYEYFSQMIGRV